MASKVRVLAQAVLKELKANFPGNETKRYYAPTFDIKEQNCRRISVVAVAESRAREARNLRKIEYDIDVAVTELTDAPKENCEPSAKTDELMDFVAEIADHFYPGEEGMFILEADGTQFKCTELKNDPIYSPKELRENKLFISVLRLTFRAYR